MCWIRAVGYRVTCYSVTSATFCNDYRDLYQTRQNWTQSVGNMPPLPPRHLLPHVLQIMPRNPKYDQFQSKGHHNEENPQSMTKIPKFDPLREVIIVPKLEKLTNYDHNLLSSEMLKNQHAKCQAISSMGSPGNAWKPQIWPIWLSQNSTKIR